MLCKYVNQAANFWLRMSESIDYNKGEQQRKLNTDSHAGLRGR